MKEIANIIFPILGLIGVVVIGICMSYVISGADIIEPEQKDIFRPRKY